MNKKNNSSQSTKKTGKHTDNKTPVTNLGEIIDFIKNLRSTLSKNQSKNTKSSGSIYTAETSPNSETTETIVENTTTISNEPLNLQSVITLVDEMKSELLSLKNTLTKLPAIELQLTRDGKDIEFVKKNYLPFSGGELVGNILMNGNRLIGLSTPSDAQLTDAASVEYVQSKLSGVMASLANASTTYLKNNDFLDDLANKIKLTQSEIKLIKIAIQTQSEDLERYNEKGSENIAKQMDDHMDSVLQEISDIKRNFLPLTGGVLEGELWMSENGITGLRNPSEDDFGGAVNVGFLKNYLIPYTSKVDSLVKRSETNSMNIASIQLNFLPLSGNKMQGTLDMNNNKLTGIPYPQNATDPVTLGYLKKVLSTLISPENTTNPTLGGVNYQTPMNSNMIFIKESQLIPSDPLPKDLTATGFVGWTWFSSTNFDGGLFPWSNVVIKESSPSSGCFDLPAPVNLNSIIGKLPGIYSLNFSMTALVPASIQISYPLIQLVVNIEKYPWSTLNNKFSKPTTIALNLVTTGQMNIGGTVYNVVELNLSNPMTTKSFILPISASKISFSLQNYSPRQTEVCNLYVIQTDFLLAWSGI